MPYKDPIKNKEFIKRYKERNRQYLKEQAYKNRIKRLYNISVDDVNKAKEMQNEKCGICNVKKYLVIDHDHKTGIFRGLLCFDCNIKLGQYEKFKHAINSMERYLGSPINLGGLN